MWIQERIQGARGPIPPHPPPPSPVKISHRKDGFRRRSHRFHVSRPPLRRCWIRYCNMTQRNLCTKRDCASNLTGIYRHWIWSPVWKLFYRGKCDQSVNMEQRWALSKFVKVFLSLFSEHVQCLRNRRRDALIFFLIKSTIDLLEREKPKFC